MLKTVSSVVNAIGALNYKGTWNASSNTPALASGAGTKGDYYQVSVAGSTSLDGISNWGVGDVAAFNGTTWQRIEGGADLNGVNLSVSGTSALDGNVTFKDNLTQGTAGKGVNFTANTPAAGMTSQLLEWYERGTFTATLKGSVSDPTTPVTATCQYSRIGKTVNVYIGFEGVNTTGASGSIQVTGLPFPASSTVRSIGVAGSFSMATFPADTYLIGTAALGASIVDIQCVASNAAWSPATHNAGTGRYLWVQMTYETA